MRSTPMIVTFCLVVFARLATAAPVAIQPDVTIRQVAPVGQATHIDVAPTGIVYVGNDPPGGGGGEGR